MTLLLSLLTALTIHGGCGITHHAIGWGPGEWEVSVRATGEVIGTYEADATGSFEYVAPNVEATGLRIRRVER